MNDDTILEKLVSAATEFYTAMGEMKKASDKACEQFLKYGTSNKTMDVVSVRHGRWVEWGEFFGRETDKKNLGVFCSLCQKHADSKFGYCPTCGAKMDNAEVLR